MEYQRGTLAFPCTCIHLSGQHSGGLQRLKCSCYMYVSYIPHKSSCYYQPLTEHFMENMSSTYQILNIRASEEIFLLQTSKREEEGGFQKYDKLSVSQTINRLSKQILYMQEMQTSECMNKIQISSQQKYFTCKPFYWYSNLSRAYV